MRWLRIGFAACVLAVSGCGDDSGGPGDGFDATDVGDGGDRADLADVEDAPADPGDVEAVEEAESIDDAVDADAEADAEGDGGTGWSVEVMSGRLPTPLGSITAVAAPAPWGVVYVFGGVNGPPPTNVVDTIVMYNPDVDSVETVGVRLPHRLFLTAAVWVGSGAYLFGGFADTALTDAILRFDADMNDVATMTATLPEPIARAGVAASGTDVFVLGGNTGGFAPSGFVTAITRYDTMGDTAAAVSATLPSGRASRIGAVACNGRVLFFGGWGAAGKSDEIIEYHPGTDAVETLATHMPTALDGGALACDGTRVLLLGGESDTVTLDEIVVFDTTDDSIEVGPVTLPTPRRGLAAVWMDGAAYVFGGQQGTGLTDEILRVTPPP